MKTRERIDSMIQSMLKFLDQENMIQLGTTGIVISLYETAIARCVMGGANKEETRKFLDDNFEGVWVRWEKTLLGKKDRPQ